MMEGWSQKKLTDFVWFQRGFDLPKSKFKKGVVPVYGSTSVLGYHNEFKVKAPGIITGRSGTLGVMQFATEDFWPHNTSLWVKDFKGNDARFAYYLLQCLDFSLFNSGGAVPTLNRNVLNAFLVEVPPLPTQKKIAAILGAYDELIENNLQRIQLLEEMAQQTYQEWFVRMRFPGHETTAINEETGLPEGWEKRELGELFELVSGFAFKSKTFIENGDYKVVTIKNVQDGVFIPETTDTVNDVPAKLKPGQRLRTGDIILSLTGNVGRVCVVYGEGYLLNQRVAKIKPFESDYLVFIYNLLRNRKTLLLLENISNGVAQQNLSPVKMVSLKLVLPPEELIENYSAMFSSGLEMCSQLLLQNTLLKEARDILLPRLMTGMIDV